MGFISKKDMLYGIDNIINSYKIDHVTSVYTTSDGTENIRYYYTDIISYSPDKKTITLNCDGWDTVTTLQRMRKLQNRVEIHKEKNIMYVSPTKHNSNYIRDRTIFYDGIQIKDGVVLNPHEEDRETKIKVLINYYCWLLSYNSNSMLDNSDIPYPNSKKDLMEMVENLTVNKYIVIEALEKVGYTKRVYEVGATTPIANSMRSYLKKHLL